MSVNPGVRRIGEVHAQLRKDFPDVELSKIRYYEDKGLVQPSRSRKGYRLYSDRDVECLREAIRLAQEEFVPLRVVRLRLIEQGLLVVPSLTSTPRHAARDASATIVSAPAPSAPTAVPTPRPVLSVVNATPPTVDDVAPVKGHFTTSDLLATTGLQPEEFNQLLSMGLVTPVIIEGETTYSALDVRVAANARALLARGVDARHLGSLRRVAEREVGVIEELTAPLRQASSAASAEQILSITSDVAREVAALRNVLVERELSAYRRD